MKIAGCGTPIIAAISNATVKIIHKVIMASPYTSTPVTGYNANPPPDDGTQTPQNELTWGRDIKGKIGDPLNTFAGAVDANLVTAFGKTLDGSSVVSTAINYPMSSPDQGRLIVATAGGVVITTPDATSVGSPFAFAINNQSNAAISLTGFNTQTVDGSATQPINPGQGCIVKTDGANWFTFGLSVNQPGFVPQGYLTLQSAAANPVLTGDITASTNVYYSPFRGPIVPIYNGTAFANFAVSQLTLALNNPGHAASTIYDVFIFLNNGAVTIGTGPAWSNSGAGTGARGTGAGTTEIARVNGLWVNANSMTARNGATTYTVAANKGTYVGSIFIDSTAGQVSCHVSFGQSRKWGVWNAYNREIVALQAGASVSSWTYDTAVTRAADNDANNSLTVFQGLAEERINLSNSVRVDISGATDNAVVGIGWNSTSSSASSSIIAIGNLTINMTMVALLVEAPFIGICTATQVEEGGGGGATITFHSGTLIARWLG